jgi:DNA-binding XRE family transcriptional regulator
MRRGKIMKISLKACRINVGASAKEFAEAIGVSEYTIYKWENGKTAPKITQVPLIVNFFESKGFPIDINNIKFNNKNSV